MKITIRYHRSTVTFTIARLSNLESLEKLSFSHPFFTWLAKLPLNKLNHIRREIRKHEILLIGWAHLMMAHDCEKSNCRQFLFLLFFFLSGLLTIHTLYKPMYKCITSSTNADYESLFFLNGLDCTPHITLVKYHRVIRGCYFVLTAASFTLADQ